MTTHLRRLGEDHGRISVWFAITAIGFLAMVCLIVDGGGRVRALQRADNIAAEAARAAGQTIRAGQAIAGGRKEIDIGLVNAAVQGYIADLDGVTATVDVAGDLQHLTVTVTTTYDPILLDLFGGGTTTVTGKATATLVAQ
jgi:Flp pilus assembly protein TadG